MKKIFVKPLLGAFPFYQDIINYPPEGVVYVDTGVQTKKGRYYFRAYNLNQSEGVYSLYYIDFSPISA